MLCNIMTFIATEPIVKYALTAVTCVAVGYMLYYCLIWPYLE